MRWTGFLIFGLFLLGFAFSRCGGDSNRIDTVACPIAPAVNRIKIADPYYNKKVQLKTRLFYGANEFRRAWLRKNRSNEMYRAFAEEVKKSYRYGFDPENYHIDELVQAVEALYDDRKRTDADISNLDIRITASFFLFTTHLIEGRVRYRGARKFFWEQGMPLENDIALLLKMESVADFQDGLEDLHPKDPQYEKLQQALKEYRELQKADSLPPVSTRIHLKPGSSHADIPSVRSKLRVRGYKGKLSQVPTLYDNELVQAVKKFQMRHGVVPTGIIDLKTARLLNVPLRMKTDLISLNLERLRWHPHLQGKGDEIVINVPEFALRGYRNGEEKMKMRVVLGTEYTPTPVFHDTLKYIIFNPTWTVPRSIFEEEFFPELQEDAAHFDPERFRFFKDGKEIDPEEEDWNDKEIDLKAYNVVEIPGKANSLGDVKFIMPNDFSVYLHDTPADLLFREEKRALSHGCIRLEKPVAFAGYLLSDKKDWNSEKIAEAMNSDEPLRVDLEKPYPVYIVYRTVWVDDEGQLQFRQDIYGHDRRHLASIQ